MHARGFLASVGIQHPFVDRGKNRKSDIVRFPAVAGGRSWLDDLPGYAPRTQKGREMLETGETDFNLPRMFLHCCRKHLFKTKVSDSTGRRLTGGELLAASLALARLLDRRVLASDEDKVGILLPPTVAAVLSNTSLALLRKIPVNLNYTLSNHLINVCVRKCKMRHVLTSRRFLEQRPCEIEADVVCLEDLESRISIADKLIGALGAYVLPVGVLERVLRLAEIQPHDLFSVIFTSGTTGEPKGVMLSYRNVASNIAAVRRLFPFQEDDTVLGILPFFHSFGSTLTLWNSLTTPLCAVFHPNPLDARQVGRLCEQHHITCLAATPTMLRNFWKRCTPAQFATIQSVVTGGEKLPIELARAFHERFGLWPIEGYGTTELSPLATGNIAEAAGSAEPRPPLRLGSVGRTIHGVEAKIVSPDTGETLPAGQQGLLMIRGPNVMLGYLDNPQATAAVMRDGWYDTGDLASVDADGLFEITGRLSQFSKIGGELVPHAQIEAALNRIVGVDEGDGPRIAVTSLPDPRRGERLIVVHEPLRKPIAQIIDELAASGIPNLWIPDRGSFVQVDHIPTVGLGKVDLGQVRILVQKQFAAQKIDPDSACGH